MASAEYTNAVNYATANAGGFVNLANSALAKAEKAVADVGFDNVLWKPISVIADPSVGPLPSAPVLPVTVLNLPAAPGAAPELYELDRVTIGATPVNTAVAPVLNFGSIPSAVGLAPLPPAIVTDFVFPDAPAELFADLPPSPGVLAKVLPTSPELLIPTFSAPAPGMPDAPPTDGEEIMARNYAAMSHTMQANIDGMVDAYIAKHSPNYFTQMASVEAQLAKYLAGGTGFSAAVEDAIYSRARGKNDAEARRVRDQSLADAATRGFTLPTGALLSATQQARQAGADANARAASEIVIMQAEMEQKNLQFAVTSTSALHDAMRNAAAAFAQSAVAINGQAADYAKSAFSNMVEMYNASLRFYTAQNEVYRTNAQIFETVLKAELAKLDVFRSEIAAFDSITQAERAQIDSYNARLNALNTLGNVFKTQVEAVVSEASLQKLKLELFQSQVMAFGSEVQAKNAEWGGYTARIGGEEAKARIYNSELSAFNAELEAYRATIQAKTAEVDMVVKQNQSKTQNFQGTVQSFVALVNAEAARSNAQNDNNRMVLTEYQKEVTAFMAAVQLATEQYRVKSETALKNATGDLSAQVELAHAKTQYGATLANLSNQGAQIYGQLASSAMAGMNTLAALTETL